MKTTLRAAFAIALASALGFVLMVGAPPQGPNPQFSRGSTDSQSHAKLAALARRATASGDRQVELTEPQAPSIHVPSLDSALTYYSAAVLEPIAKQTVVDEDEQLYTWYKCKLVTTLSKIEKPLPPLAQSLATVPEALRPTDLLPLQPGEVLIPRRGGTVTIDNIPISSKDRSFPDFILSQRYFVLLNFSPDEKIGVIPLQEAGVFRIDADDRLLPLSDRNYPVAQDMMLVYQNSLQALQKELTRR